MSILNKNGLILNTKRLTISNDKLYIADVDELVEVDIPRVRLLIIRVMAQFV